MSDIFDKALEDNPDIAAALTEMEDFFKQYTQLKIMAVGPVMKAEGVQIPDHTTDANKVRLAAVLMRALHNVMPGDGEGYKDLLKIADEMEALGWVSVTA